ncbi:hypothetical protein HS088_TW20G00695 [Tripterygium wilfordii]|uniref:Uncharacterized protein n=1 Tax=Tripterygium wilfordii TaxID=458696 RepID=A0A7J7C873_TRIWF|nr:hypothetical protein HS088_TW20G00695 [Tripterygium wilfordii]
MAKLEEGDVNAATELFQRAVNVTPSMAHQLIQMVVCHAPDSYVILLTKVTYAYCFDLPWLLVDCFQDGPVLSVLKSRQMPEDYSKSFKEALAVFQHARIEIPASLASAIAEGKLDPTNMEAFDCSSSPERCPYPFVTETCGVQKNKTAAASRRNRSNIVSSSPTVENNITGKFAAQYDLY